MFIPSRSYATLEQSADAFENMSGYWDTMFWGYVEGYGWVDSFYVSCV